MINKEKSKECNCGYVRGQYEFHHPRCALYTPSPALENYERDYSHYHCWQQVENEDSDIEPQKTPACGQPLEKHTQCCLCDTPAPKSEEEKIIKGAEDFANRFEGVMKELAEEESKEKGVVGDIGVFNGTKWVKVKPEDVFSMVEKARQHLKDELVRAGEGMKKEPGLYITGKNGGDYINYRRDDDDEKREIYNKAIEDYQNIIQQK